MFLPYSTDAPIYYWPYTTVGLIVVNSLIFISLLAGLLPNAEGWLLFYGEGLTPFQWLTSMFIHGSLMHLLGNMLFLWVFGLVVEGKLGWWKFLCCYLSIGILQSAMEQTIQLILHGEGASLGASSAIYGIMAMAAIWAPKNDVSVFYWMFAFLMGTIEVPIMMLAGFYIGFDLLLTPVLGFNSSSWLHIGGVLIGTPLGIALLRMRVVDCEGWDLFSVLRNDHGRKLDQEIQKANKEIAKKIEQRKEIRESQIVNNARTQIKLYLDEGNTDAAIALYHKLQKINKGLNLPRDTLLLLATEMHRQKMWAQSCVPMAEILERFPEEDNHKIYLKLAQICVVELERPGRALELLKQLDLKSLSPELLKMAQKIAQRAKQLQMEGTVELDDEDW